LAIDPNYAQALSGLALCYYVLAVMGAKPAGEMTPPANSAAEKAIAIDPSDSESHTVLAVMAEIFDYDWNRAEKHHRMSVAVERVSPRARCCYGVQYLLHKERATEAIGQSRLALQSDPLSMLFHFGLVWCLYFNGQHGEAIVCARRA
jgi:Tfp pilus assembly protein PilF